MKSIVNNRNGAIEDTIQLPVESISGLAFGGPKMDILFVTTTKSIYFNYFDVTVPVGMPSENPQAGQVFMITGLNTKGCPHPRLKNRDI